jgi:hypothetical protein
LLVEQFEPKQAFPFFYDSAVKLTPLPKSWALSFSPRFPYLYFSIFLFLAALLALFSLTFSLPVIFLVPPVPYDHEYLF